MAGPTPMHCIVDVDGRILFASWDLASVLGYSWRSMQVRPHDVVLAQDRLHGVGVQGFELVTGGLLQRRTPHAKSCAASYNAPLTPHRA